MSAPRKKSEAVYTPPTPEEEAAIDALVAKTGGETPKATMTVMYLMSQARPPAPGAARPSAREVLGAGSAILAISASRPRPREPDGGEGQGGIVVIDPFSPGAGARCPSCGEPLTKPADLGET